MRSSEVHHRRRGARLRADAPSAATIRDVGPSLSTDLYHVPRVQVGEMECETDEYPAEFEAVPALRESFLKECLDSLGEQRAVDGSTKLEILSVLNPPHGRANDRSPASARTGMAYQNLV